MPLSENARLPKTLAQELPWLSLCERVANGELDNPEAEKAGKVVLRDNALRLYGIAVK